jgi:cyclophilin family peptidyl-prolyl cis-trans isomerase
MNLRKLKKYITILFLSITILIGGCATQPDSSAGTSTNTSSPKIMSWAKPPAMQIDTNKQYSAAIQTEKGNLVIDLFAKDVPATVNNFVFLARQGFYDGVTFHRVIKNPPVAQGGDPTGTGSGGPGYGIANEITQHKHITGAVSMAHSSLPNSNGSQFFICYTDIPYLDGGYSVFGQLQQSSMEVLQKLTPRDPSTNPNFLGTKIIKVTIEER